MKPPLDQDQMEQQGIGLMQMRKRPMGEGEQGQPRFDPHTNPDYTQVPMQQEMMGGGQMELTAPVLVTRILEIPELREQYVAAIEEMLEEIFTEEWMFEQAEELQGLLLETNKERVFWTDEELESFTSSYDELLAFITNRIDYLENELVSE